jgi:NAD-dependent dihydropyrimidine dehydrogenase PreA subunit
VIELINAERCTNCNICVRICPTDVFDRTADGPPVISRQDVCQTCFMCEAHCPEDAMYVAPMRQPAEPGSPHLEEQRLLHEGYFGSYRARLGWGEGGKPPHTGDELLELSLIGPRVMTGTAESTATQEESA